MFDTPFNSSSPNNTTTLDVDKRIALDDPYDGSLPDFQSVMNNTASRVEGKMIEYFSDPDVLSNLINDIRKFLQNEKGKLSEDNQALIANDIQNIIQTYDYPIADDQLETLFQTLKALKDQLSELSTINLNADLEVKNGLLFQKSHQNISSQHLLNDAQLLKRLNDQINQTILQRSGTFNALNQKISKRNVLHPVSGFYQKMVPFSPTIDFNQSLISEKLPFKPVELVGLSERLASSSTEPSVTAEQASATQSTVHPSTGLRKMEGLNFTPTFHLENKQWGQNIGGNVLWMISQNRQSASIQIYPLELGGVVDVRIKMDGHRAHLHFTTPNANVQQALSDGFPKLQEMMNKFDIQVSEENISYQGHDQKQGSDQKQRDETRFSGEHSERSETESSEGGSGHIGLVDDYV